MRLALAIVIALAGCASRQPPTLPVPPAGGGDLAGAARAVSELGEVQPVLVALTNGGSEAVQVDARQVFALTAASERIAPLPPGEAARQAGGRRLPGAVEGGAKGTLWGGATGALGGAIAGAIQGGIGMAVATGAAVGAAVGAVTGVIFGAYNAPPDVAGFTDRALPTGTLNAGGSTTGYLYYPAGRYDALEVQAGTDTGGAPRVIRVPLEPDA